MELETTEIISFFRARKGKFETRYGAELSMSEDEGLRSECKLPSLSQSSMSIRVETDMDSVYSFIEGFQLKEISDIDRISYNYVWMRYLKGEGAFFVKHRALDQEIGFRLISLKTIVFSKALHFYDEVDRHLTMPDEFEEFVEMLHERYRNESLSLLNKN